MDKGHDKLLDRLLKEVEELKQGNTAKELQYMTALLEDIKEDHKTMKSDIDTLNKRLLDPDQGLVVKVNKNTEHRESWHSKSDKLNEMYRWKSSITKALWVLFGAVISIVVKIFFN